MQEDLFNSNQYLLAIRGDDFALQKNSAAFELARRYS
jgi:hypothetical protein